MSAESTWEYVTLGLNFSVNRIFSQLILVVKSLTAAIFTPGRNRSGKRKTSNSKTRTGDKSGSGDIRCKPRSRDTRKGLRNRSQKVTVLGRGFSREHRQAHCLLSWSANDFVGSCNRNKSLKPF